MGYIFTMGKGGYIGSGPKHRDKEGGLYVIDPQTGRPVMMVERGEAIVSAGALDATDEVALRGTPSKIISTLNRMYGGRGWDGGAEIIHMNSRRAVARRALRIDMPGSAVNGTGMHLTDPPPVGNIGMNEPEGITPTSYMGNEELLAVLRKLDKRLDNLYAKVFIKDIDEARRDFDRAKRASGW